MPIHGGWKRRAAWTAALLGSVPLWSTGCSTPETALSHPLRPADYPPAVASESGTAETVTAHYAPADDASSGERADESASGGTEIAAGELEVPFLGLELISARQEREGDAELAPLENGLPPFAALPDAEREGAAPDPAQDIPTTPLPQPEAPLADRYPIDLATAFRLAGANNLQIALAAEQVREAAAQLDRAELLWVPSVDLGVGYNRHDGQIQDTRGQVIDVSRQSGFVGGGPRVGDAPLNGLTGGPPRLFLGLNPAEAYFAPLAAQQATRAQDAGHAAAFNDALLDVGIAYYELVRSQLRVAIAREAAANAEELVELTENFVQAGAGLQADVVRARAQLADARVEVLEAQEGVRVNSAELARLLRLDQNVILHPAELLPLPVTLVSTDVPLPELIAQGLSARPELAREQALVAEAQARLRQECWRPWVPNIYLGTSAGGFGGGSNDFFGNFEGRSDFDALAVWSFENLGLGNHARQREQASVQRQRMLEFQRTYDRVAADIAQAYARAQIRREQVEVAEIQVAAAAEALPLNFRGIRGGELRPIEAQQAIDQLAEARRRYLAAVIEYDQAQLRLLRAIGQPPSTAAARPAAGALSSESLDVPPAPAMHE